MDAVVTMIGQVGFPIAISLWFLFKLEKVIVNNTTALVRVEKVLDRIRVANNK